MGGRLQKQFFNCLIKVLSKKRRKLKSFYNDKKNDVQPFEVRGFVSTINNISAKWKCAVQCG